MVKRVCLVSGGTGGHLMPALTLAQALADRGHLPLLVTEGRPAEQSLLESAGVIATQVPVGRRGLTLPFRLARAVLRARRLLRRERVDLVVGTGGRTTVPVALAARSLGVPFCLLEQNAVPGRANRWLLPLAQRIYLGLPVEERVPRSLVTGTPLRREVGAVDRDSARRSLGLDERTPVLLVTGGSQGARALNETVPRALVGLRVPLQVIHVAGLEGEAAVRLLYAEAASVVRAIVRPLSRDMATLYAAADLVICRGGGGTVAELIAAGRASVIVPYPHHRDRQQLHNARVLERAGAAVVLEQDVLTAATLRETVAELLRREGVLSAMGARARALLPDGAADRILDDLRRLVALE
jgi:UDP-N-acetylglucosamine--N-acetylmuramyl-(pentapeptide) pyrophosphoryl-undecaprenol N-acetylglucosamine transferase